MRVSEEQIDLAMKVLPGGVNSSTRLNQAIGMPFFASRAKGSRVRDIEGREYIDMCCSHGASLLGYAHPAIDKAVRKAMELGYVNSFETEYHEELARRFCEFIPCAEKVRFCSAGSEATLHLIRACRGFTGRKKIIRFEGHFHGYHELIYIGGHPPPSALSQNRSKPYVESAGIPEEYAQFILPIPYNDPEALKQTIERHGRETAAVLLEPVNYNCACIKPQKGYLELLRKLTKESGILLFFDEIQSAFKKSSGGAQEDFGVVPDVCTVGKSMGGGFPLSAFCGRSDVMEVFKPTGPVQHSGTFNAHLIPILAGLAFLDEVAKPQFYQHLQEIEKHFHDGVDRIINEGELNMIIPHHGARFNILLGRQTPALCYEDTFCHDNKIMLQLVKDCWERGVYFHDYGGSPAHHGYSIQHTIEDIDTVLNVLEEVLRELKNELKIRAWSNNNGT